MVPEGLANTLANALGKDTISGTAAGSAGSVGWSLPMSGKTGTTESHRSSGFLGFTNQYAAANYIFDDTPNPSGLCSYPLRKCGNGNLYGGNEPARTWFLAMKPIADRLRSGGAAAHRPALCRRRSGQRSAQRDRAELDAARKRLQDAGFQVADQPTPINSYPSRGAVVGTTPKDQSRSRFDRHDQHEQRDRPGAGVLPAQAAGDVPPPPPPDAPPPDANVINIPGLPPITLPAPPPPPPGALPPPP